MAALYRSGKKLHEIGDIYGVSGETVRQLHCEYDADLLRKDDIKNLVDKAGFGVGVGEWRPEKGGDYGRFRFLPIP